MLWHLDMNFFSTEYFGMQVLVCKSSICNTNLFFVLPFSVNMQLTFLLSSVEEVWLLFYMFAFQMRDLGRERKRGSISKRHRNIARKLTNFHICYFVGSIYQFLLSTLRTCGRFVIKIWWYFFFHFKPTNAIECE